MTETELAKKKIESAIADLKLAKQNLSFARSIQTIALATTISDLEEIVAILNDPECEDQ